MILGRLREAVLSSPLVRAYATARCGPFTVRVLRRGDADRVDRFAARYLQSMRPHILRQCQARWPEAGFAVAAFDVKQRVIGFGFIDEYQQERVPLEGWWLRSLKVAPQFRNAGIGMRIMTVLYEEAVRRGNIPVYVDIFAGNACAIRLQRKLGLVDAPSEIVEAAQRVPWKDPAPRVILMYSPF
jgi:GNAT superfamily N-acetyltransferase